VEHLLGLVGAVGVDPDGNEYGVHGSSFSS
jgi:hypothetical protein